MKKMALSLVVLISVLAVALTTPSNAGEHKTVAKVSTRNGNELARDFLEFIEGLRQPSDLNATRLEKTMGMKLRPVPEQPDVVRYMDYSNDGWQYWFIVKPRPGGLHALEFGTYVGKPGEAKPCTFELAQFSKALQALGYQEIKVRPHPLPGNLWDFSKPPFALYANVYRSGDTEGRECISTLKIESGRVDLGEGRANTGRSTHDQSKCEEARRAQEAARDAADKAASDAEAEWRRNPTQANQAAWDSAREIAARRWADWAAWTPPECG